MAQIYVENFRRGLDRRKSLFTAPPGSLRECRNAHITRGGEIEKRGVFDVFADLPDGTFGLHTVRDQVYVFGSEPRPDDLGEQVQYQQLSHPDGEGMSRVLHTENFAGRVYAVAEFEDGSIHHFYNGERVAEWDDIASDIADSEGVASVLGSRLSARLSSDFSVTVDERTISVTGPGGESFSSDSSSKVSRTVVQEANEEKLAQGSFDIASGSDGGEITQVTVDGVDILSGSVAWDNDAETTASAVADAINEHESDPDYSASADGDTVTVEAMSGTGSDPNGYTVDVETSDVTVENVTDMDGGEDEEPQVLEAEVDSSLGPNHEYSLTVDGSTVRVYGNSSGVGRTALTFRQKVYSTSLSVLYFSGFSGESDNGVPTPDPTAWDSTEHDGAGWVDMSTHEAGASNLTGLGIYQDTLAVFSRASVQLWELDADPAQSAQVQVLPNLGTLAPRSITSYGDQDLFFLSESGVRSMRARDSSNVATSEDVGSPIDDEVVAYLRDEGSGVREEAIGAIEPRTQRFWLSLGDRIYVLSHYPGSEVTAWSKHEAPAPVTDMAAGTGTLYLRAGDQILEVGDPRDNDEPAEVQLPFLDGEQPALEKQLLSLDVGCEGEWEVFVHPDPSQPDFFESVGRVHGTTFGFQPIMPATGISTHFSLRFRSVGDGYHRLSNVIMHYKYGNSG